jgi:hypothetical protein
MRVSPRCQGQRSRSGGAVHESEADTLYSISGAQAYDGKTRAEHLREMTISSGVVHELPADLKKALATDPQALAAWEDITPLSRNEWICWIESAKKAETRSRRIAWGCSSLKDGKRRPCCWPGCAHR